MIINEKYSFKDFTGQSFIDLDSDEFSNSEIIGSCFAQENESEKHIFPIGMIGVIFTRCNLDNVMLLGNNIIGKRCSNQRIMVQNDGQDWIIDSAHNPIEPVSIKQHKKLNLSIDPADLPADLMREQWVIASDFDAVTNWTARTSKGKNPVRDIDFWFREKPEIIETQIRGEITHYLIRGKAWRFRGE